MGTTTTKEDATNADGVNDNLKSSSKATVSEKAEVNRKKMICYAQTKDNIRNSRWVYCTESPLLDLDKTIPKSFSFYGDVCGLFKKLSQDNFYFIDESNVKKLEKRNLYVIQGDESKVKPFDNVVIENNNATLSETFLIEQESYQYKEDLDDVFLFNIDGLSLGLFYGIRFSDKGNTLREIIEKRVGKKIPSVYSRICFIESKIPSVEWETDVVHKNLLLPEKINEDLGITLSDIIPKEYPFYFLHSTNYFDHIFVTKKICNYGQCETEAFNETTGKYLFPKLSVPTHASAQAPGIYMEHLKLDTRFSLPLEKNDLFRTIRYSSNYGDIGFIFPLEEIFKYHVNIMGDQGFGYGRKVDLNDYYSLDRNSEIVIRANSIDLEKAIAVSVIFSSIELQFIYNFLPRHKQIQRSALTLGQIIDFYKEFRSERWFLRKSNLLKVVDAYGEENLPPLYIFQHERTDPTYGIYETIYDTDSETDEVILGTLVTS